MNNKEKIISTALELFSLNGYTETSVDSIAKHANVSKGLTYTHFKNKEALLVATIESTITKMTSEIMEVDEMGFQSFFQFFFDSLRKNKETIRLCLLLVIHPKTPAKVISLLDEQKKELLLLLSSLLQAQFQEHSAKEAEILLATLDGITIEYTINPIDERLTQTHEYLTNKYTT